jgi:hypothetical protein
MDEMMERYEAALENAFSVFDWFGEVISKLSMLVMRGVHFVLSKSLDIAQAIGMTVYPWFRWTTIPFNYLIVRTFLWYIYRDDGKEPLDIPGVHYIVSPPGGGKSMLAFQKSNEIADDTGYGSYHTSRIEKPRLSRDGRFYVVSHRVINPKDYYEKRKKVMRFNTTKYKALFFDEFHAENNSRLNKESAYNDFFIPFMNDLIKMRHFGFDRNIYLFSQVPNNDIQIMSIIARYHEVTIKKGLRYTDWIARGRFKIEPLYFIIKTYRMIRTTENFRKKLDRVWKKRVDIPRLDYFDTHAMAHEHDELPYDFK